MSDQSTAALDAIQAQLKELDAILGQTNADLNTVAGTERLAKWKARTAAVLTQVIGPQAGQEFAGKQPGPSFTNDLLEEFTDLVEFYRTALLTLSKRSNRPS